LPDTSRHCSNWNRAEPSKQSTNARIGCSSFDWLVTRTRQKEFAALTVSLLDLETPAGSSNILTDVISGVVEQTRQQIVATKRRPAEQAEMKWRDNFQPHAIILTERTRPAPIFVAAIIGVERLLRVDFDLDGEREGYVKKSLEAFAG
jgi:hypothetical protein